MVRDDIKECRIKAYGIDNKEGSVFLTKEEYEIAKKVMNEDNWYNIITTGVRTPIFTIDCSEWEET